MMVFRFFKHATFYFWVSRVDLPLMMKKIPFSGYFAWHCAHIPLYIETSTYMYYVIPGIEAEFPLAS